jgi:hypothetical protein
MLILDINITSYHIIASHYQITESLRLKHAVMKDARVSH